MATTMAKEDMSITFSVNDTSKSLWESCKAVDQEGNPLEADKVAKALFLQWVREKASLD